MTRDRVWWLIVATTLLLAVALASKAQGGTATTVPQAKAEIRRLWGSQASRAMCIINRESHWDPRAVSRTGDHGLFQLHAATWRRYFGARWQLVYDPVSNVRMAYELYRRAGFQPWAGGAYSC